MNVLLDLSGCLNVSRYPEGHNYTLQCKRINYIICLLLYKPQCPVYNAVAY